MATQYRMIKQKKKPISLLEISGDRVFTSSLYLFGPNYFSENVKEMQKKYFHPQIGEIISFREPTTAESILIASYNFPKRVKSKIFDSEVGVLQLGRIVRTSEGVFANPPKDKDGNSIIDEKILKQYLNKAEKINGIYLGDNDFSFAPYESFKRGSQDVKEFIKGGLARLLEHANIAENLKNIASKKNYPRGVYVCEFEQGFDQAAGLTFKVIQYEPILNIISLGSFIHDQLYVDIDVYNGYNCGYAFGVLK